MAACRSSAYARHLPKPRRLRNANALARCYELMSAVLQDWSYKAKQDTLVSEVRRTRSLGVVIKKVTSFLDKAFIGCVS